MNAREIFAAALEKNSSADRSAFLAEACGNDQALQEQIESLLREHDSLGSFLEQPAFAVDATVNHEPPILEGPGTVIGPYKLLQQIGEGGMGVVFMAEQAEPIQRTVALKIIKPGMDTRQVIARFEAERQALAMMDHPNIAKVLDAGTTDSGRPYFVMELVKGVPITKYCDEKQLTLRERLELLKPVCEAVQHAHQKGIIHRDIKPTNVLVAEYDNRAVQKVIDFGVAKATAQKLTERTMFTEFGQVIGTVEYMSPEQAKFNQLDIDTRSDIYSLGVLLYELLTGSTPFEQKRLREAAFDEVLRIIREEEPPKPSTRLSTSETLPSIAANRHTEPGRLSKDIRGELDWIVMKCLEKDRNRRYETANGLLRDMERYLTDEPVQACPPSAVYRLKKFIRRNKLAAAFMGLLTVGLVALAVSNLLIQSALTQKNAALADKEAALTLAQQNEQRATTESARATTESARAQAVSNFMLEMIFSPSRGWRVKGSQYTVREMLDDYAAGLGNQLADQPEVEAQIHNMFGCSYLMLGVHDRAEPHLKRAIELRRNVGGPQRNSLADSLTMYGANLYLQRRYDEAEPPLREALENYHQRGVRGTMPIFVCRVLQQALAGAGRYDEAERVIQEAWAEMQDYDKLPPKFAQFPDSDVADTCAGFAYYYATIGREKEAAEFLRRATLAQERLRKSIDSLNTFQILARMRLRLGDQPGYREACAKLAVPPPRDANDASPYNFDDEVNLGRIFTCCLGPDAVDDPSVLVKQAEEFAAHNALQAPYLDLAVLGSAHYRAGHYQEAAQCLEQSIHQYPSDPPPSHSTVLVPQLFLVMTKWQQGEHDDARRLLREIEPAIDKSLATPNLLWQRQLTKELLRRQARALIEPKKTDEAVEKGNPSPEEVKP